MNIVKEWLLFLAVFGILFAFLLVWIRGLGSMNELIDGRIYRNEHGTHYKLLHGYVGASYGTVCVVQHVNSKKLYIAAWARMTNPRWYTLMPADFETSDDFKRLNSEGKMS